MDLSITNSNLCPLSRWCHPTTSSSVVPFSSCLQSFPASGSCQMSQFFASDGQGIGVSASASVLPTNIQGWFPLGLTGWISLQSNRVLLSIKEIGKASDIDIRRGQKECPLSSFLARRFLSVAAAAAKSLQSCPTLCNPIDRSPPGSPIPGILQARTLEWVAISFSNTWKWKVKVKSLSHVWLLVTPSRLQPTRLLRPWDFPGKSTGVVCHH